MKFTHILFIPVLFFFCSCSNTNNQKNRTDNIPKAVFIILDGIAPQVLQEVNTPAIDSIARVGGYSNAYVGGKAGSYSQSPTVSAVGYNHLLTGTWSNKHNVWGNEIKAPNYHYWSLFRLVEEQDSSRKTAIFSTWLDNRTKLIGAGKQATDNLTLDYHFDGFEHDTLQFPHDKETRYIADIDDHVAQEAARYIGREGPDLSWVYLQYPDNMGHKYGYSEQYNQSIKTADRQVADLWEAIQQRQKNYPEDWLIIITTDHGRDRETGKGHGGQSPYERATWIVTNADSLNSHFKNETPAIVDIYPTVTRHMDIQIPEEQQRELDGIPLAGPVSISNVEGTFNEKEQTIDLSWDALNPEGNLNILISRTNNFETGGTDQYQQKQTVPVKTESATVPVKNSTMYKVVLQAPENIGTSWVFAHDSLNRPQVKYE